MMLSGAIFRAIIVRGNMAEDAVLIDKKLEKVLRKTAFSKKYYRAGVLCAVACTAVTLFTISYAISSGAMISPRTPVFAASLIATGMVLLCLVYMAIVAALEKRSRRFCSAEGTISSNTLVTGTRLNLRVTRLGGQKGYSAFQLCLVHFVVASMFLFAVTLGMLMGKGVSLQQLLSVSPGAVIPGVALAATILKIAAVSLLVSTAFLFIARLFVEEGVSNVRVFVFPDCHVPLRINDEQSEDTVGDGTFRGLTAYESGRPAADDVTTTRMVNDAATAGYISCMLGSAEYVTSLLSEGKQRDDHTSVVECVVSAKSTGAFQLVGK
ncbi:hypothetical protein [Candidatus Anaplasma sp. TIGMIC]|uniref:hypothetical protein n=1 Tax=Candidatus Anaplasma sp. TIGMIC TaxID=3020713 RepID=UPI00232B88AE|nr:hypothetical protein [Candidatus Anaplasma sp. TIGMIC]MDB1135328.1 hypothetical protein [Candidatus Anaplasma sp. TIGMIC]